MGKLRLKEGWGDRERNCHHSLYKLCMAWKEHRHYSSKPHLTRRPTAK